MVRARSAGSAAGAQQPQPPDHALLGEQPSAELQRRCDGM
jgi:hypothetical protein